MSRKERDRIPIMVGIQQGELTLRAAAQVSGLPRRKADLSGPAVRSYSKVVAADKRLENYTDFPDATNDQVQVLVNGLPVASTNTAGLRTVSTYDALARVQQTDTCTGNSDTTIGPSVISTQFEYVPGTTLLQKLLDTLNTGTPSNNLKAGVEYGPYGEIVRGTGDLTLLPFRFQTKWALEQSWQGSLALEHRAAGVRAELQAVAQPRPAG